MTNKPAGSNGFNNKEMLVMLLQETRLLGNRIDQLHEKVNSKMSRQELMGWITAFAVLTAAMMSFFRS